MSDRAGVSSEIHVTGPPHWEDMLGVTWRTFIVQMRGVEYLIAGYRNLRANSFTTTHLP